MLRWVRMRCSSLNPIMGNGIATLFRSSRVARLMHAYLASEQGLFFGHLLCQVEYSCQCCSCWQRRDVRSRHGYLEPLLRWLRSKHLQPTLLLRDVLDVRSLSVSHSCAAHVVALHTVAQLAKSRTKFTRVSAKNFRGT